MKHIYTYHTDYNIVEYHLDTDDMVHTITHLHNGKTNNKVETLVGFLSKNKDTTVYNLLQDEKG